MTRKQFSILVVLMTLLSSSVISVSLEVRAEQNMEPKWTYEEPGCFNRVAISADGKYLSMGTNDTGKLYLFQGNASLWNYTVGTVHSISMSFDGKYIAVGAGSSLHLFDREISSSPLLSYPVDFETSIVALSSDGKHVVIGTMSSVSQQDAESKVYVFERDQSEPSWATTLPGVLESLSMSSNGSYIVASTSWPGVLYLFAREQEAPMWSYDFGDRCGGVRISGDGQYILATGGNQSGDSSKRVFLFYRQNSTPRYMKIIPEIPSLREVSLSLNGSVFVVSYVSRNELVLFDMNVRPYSARSIRNVTLAARRVSVVMSSDGRYVFVGSLDGVFVYEYLNNELRLKDQYNIDSPVVYDVACSPDGRYVVAVGSSNSLDDGLSQVYFFETENVAGSWMGQLYPMIVGVVVFVVAGFVGFAFYRRIRRKE